MKNKLRNISTVIIALLILLCCFPLPAFAVTHSGTCGDNMTWTFDTDTGVLTISGTGDMYDYIADYDTYEYTQPWYSHSLYIKKLVINEGVTSIGDNAFVMNDFSEVSLPDSLISIGERAFFNCNNLKNVNIPDNVTYIGDSAFEACQFMEQVTIPASVKNIGWCAFNSGEYLLSINVHPANNYYSSDDNGTLYNKSKTQLIEFPAARAYTSYTVADGVTEICDLAFDDCKNLEHITLPDSITVIGKAAFQSCENLKTINMPSGVTVINDYTFEYCENLERIEIPEGIKSIGSYAFTYCTGLKDGKLVIPSSVETIGDYAFLATNLSNITVDEDNQYFTNDEHGALYNKTKTKLIKVPAQKSIKSYTIPESVTEIAPGAFVYSITLKSIIIPNSITTISELAFVKNYSLTDIYYTGSEEEWNSINISEKNEIQPQITIHYNYVDITNKEEPTTSTEKKTSETKDEKDTESDSDKVEVSRTLVITLSVVVSVALAGSATAITILVKKNKKAI